MKTHVKAQRLFLAAIIALALLLGALGVTAKAPAQPPCKWLAYVGNADLDSIQLNQGKFIGMKTESFPG